jgi:hypothetical protein
MGLIEGVSLRNIRVRSKKPILMFRKEKEHPNQPPLPSSSLTEIEE